MFRKKRATEKPPLYLHNTLGNAQEAFVPLKKGSVRMYNCGPTVYNIQHIGNLRSYVFADILRRTFMYNGYAVTQAINITDVGHLTGDNEGDADTGEDKMTEGLKREGLKPTLKNMHKLGERYTKQFLEDVEKLNIPPPDHLPRASEHIREQIALIQTLEEKGYVYKTSDGMYFEVSRFPAYGALGMAGSDAQHARVARNPEKRDPRDFAVWKFNEELGWESPWGKGFPGWHIECSAMSMKYLGKSFDIHTGGIDHIAVHHNNEIAQSEAATGKPFARYWLHNNHITVEGRKISKSIGNTIYLYNLEDRGYSPLAYRHWLLTGHYRSAMNFTWEALDGARTAIFKLHRYFVEELSGPSPQQNGGTVIPEYQRKFHAYVNDDLDTPRAIALLWELEKDTAVSDADKRVTLLDFDRVLGIGLQQANEELLELLSGNEQRLTIKEAPESVQELVGQRERARREKDFEKADVLRKEVEKQGYRIEDTEGGPILRHSHKESRQDSAAL